MSKRFTISDLFKKIGRMRHTRGVAALEFACVAPVIAVLFVGSLDISRAYILWEETNNAADAIVQAAEKIAASGGGGSSQLTYTQMQAAMSTIYAELPGLAYGNGTGFLGKGPFWVTLSEVDFSPRCSTTANCPPQTPTTLWSSYLAEGGAYLDKTSTSTLPLYRACGALVPVAYFPNDNTQLLKMVTPTMTQTLSGATSTPSTALTLEPQLVADVATTFIPTFGRFVPSIVFRASATMPAPLGGPDEEVSFIQTAPLGNVTYCGPIT